MADYEDARIRCDDRGIRIRGYRFPWGDKVVRYPTVAAMDRFELGPGRGSGRIWGSSDLRHWFNYDPARPSKAVGFSLTLRGRRVVPVVTPDDPGAFEAAVRPRLDGGRAA